MSRRKSRIWTFFDQIVGEVSKVKCNQCQAVISRGGVGKSANNTSMTNHIKYKHSELMAQLTAVIKSSSTERSPSPSQFSSSQASVASTSAVKCQLSQQTIQESIAVKWSIDDSRSREIHISIGKMIALDNQPISIVENTGFTSLMKKLKPKYNLPSRKYFSDNIIPYIYSETKAEIKKGIVSTIAISVTTDLWTNTNNLQSFLSFTAHWLNDNFQLQHAVLQMKHFSGLHTADNIKQHLEEIPTLWDINPTKIHAIV